MEYGFYIGNFGGKLVPVPSKLPDFSLDLGAIESAITDKTRVVLIDSPNNPTGALYNQSELKGLAAILALRGRAVRQAHLPRLRRALSVPDL